LRLLPLSFGLLIASFGSGFLVSQTGRYKIFPVIGTALMTVGLALLSRLDEHTGAVVVSVSMMVFGFGVGLLMSVLTIAVQNASEYRDLGVATSGITFLRSLAGSVGVALFGALFTSHLTEHLPSGLPAGVMRDPFAAHSLHVAAAAGYYRDYVSSLQILFLAGIPMAFLGFLTSLFLREVPLRTTSRATAVDRVGESFGFLEPADSTIELQRAVSALIRQDRTAGASILSRSGVGVNIAEGWVLGQVARAEAGNGSVSLDELGHATGVPPAMLRPAVDELVSRGFLRQEQQHLSVSGMGHTALQRMVAAWRDWLLERLADWNPEHQASLVEALDILAARVSGEQPAAHVGLT
jgi:DNA-binding MarR family transcriptional regulator